MHADERTEQANYHSIRVHGFLSCALCTCMRTVSWWTCGVVRCADMPSTLLPCSCPAHLDRSDPAVLTQVVGGTTGWAGSIPTSTPLRPAHEHAHELAKRGKIAAKTVALLKP